MEKNQGLAFQKVAKSGNIGGKSPVAGGIEYVRYHSMQKVNALKVSLRKSTCTDSDRCNDTTTICDQRTVRKLTLNPIRFLGVF